MIYQKNSTMDFLDIDETNLVVYDPESGDTHYIGETGKAILMQLEQETPFETLIDALCEAYEAEREVIAADTKEFLDDLVAKKVVLAK